MTPIAQMLRPDVTVVTTIMTEHQEFFGTLEGTRAEKSEMVRVLPAAGTAVLNGDDPHVRWMQDQTRARVVTYGLDAGNDIGAESIALDWPRGMRFRLNTYGETRDVSVRLLGRHMVYPILAGVAVALAEGMNLDDAVAALGSLPPTLGRLQLVPLEDGTVILRDDAKTGIESTEAALNLLAEIPAKRRGVVLGELYDLLGDPGPVYHSFGQRIAEFAEFAIFVGADPAVQAYIDGATSGGLAPGRIVHVRDPYSETLQAVREQMEPGDVILVKGISSRRLGQVSLALEGRSVRCTRQDCRWGIFCDYCPILERGWA
jgi:UDP-N-acetylmuramoyl-tripeptide--D-alanyl-D-alanine ligase